MFCGGKATAKERRLRRRKKRFARRRQSRRKMAPPLAAQNALRAPAAKPPQKGAASGGAKCASRIGGEAAAKGRRLWRRKMRLRASAAKPPQKGAASGGAKCAFARRRRSRRRNTLFPIQTAQYKNILTNPFLWIIIKMAVKPNKERTVFYYEVCMRPLRMGIR